VYSALAGALRRGKAQVREDLGADPYLLYILLLATLLCAFWIWHRLPNFATRDERWRVLDVAQPVGRFIEDPSLGSIREGVTYWRSYGGTFYVYGLVILPVLVFLITAGEGGVIVDLADYSITDLRGGWHGVPGWVWTAIVLPARLVNVAFAVGSVYLVYRIGTKVDGRATGRLAALLLSLTWGVLVLAHEAGEDVPALFFFLLAVYLAVQYVESGSRRTFYLGSLCGGLAAGFKLTAGVSALVLGVAHLQYARRSGESLQSAVLQPRFLGTGVAIGIGAILFSYPQMLVGAPVEIGERVSRGASAKGNPHGWLVAPSWWWLTRGFLNGLGLPLALASVAGVSGALGWIHERSRVGTFSRLALLVIGVILLVYSGWAYVRTHHLLLLFPLVILLVAIGAGRLSDRRPTVTRVLVAALVLSTATYAVVGDLGYAAQGRDRAAVWLTTHAGPNATVESYVRDPQDTAVPHHLDYDKPPVPGSMTDVTSRCPDYILLHPHRSLLYVAPDSHNDRADKYDDSEASAYVSALLDEEGYPYEVAGRFGREPSYLDGGTNRSTAVALLWAGIQPRTVQYGDPQDFGPHQYTVVLERSEPCEEA